LNGVTTIDVDEPFQDVIHIQAAEAFAELNDESVPRGFSNLMRNACVVDYKSH